MTTDPTNQPNRKAMKLAPKVPPARVGDAVQPVSGGVHASDPLGSALPHGSKALKGGIDRKPLRHPADQELERCIRVALAQLDDWKAANQKEHPQPYPECVARIRVALEQHGRAVG